VPSFPEKGASITALELASHSSGITDSRDNPDAANATHYPSVSASLARFQDAPLLSPPGSRYDYSSYGYVLLSAVVEGASGEGFLSYMHRHIFEPLRMSHTMEDDVTKALPQRAHFYSYGRGGAAVDAPFDDLSKYWGAAGFLSTSEDLVRFGSTLLRGDFLNPPTRRVVFSPHSRVRPFVGYGLGWMLARDLHLREVYFHPGGIIGARSMLACYPREKMCFALLTNIGHTQLPFARLMGIVNPFLDAAP
jgi:CubicO group peptidase (beta-lactamase class C family)